MHQNGTQGFWARALRHLRIPCPRFIGREAELLWLSERQEEARRGRGDLVFIAGEAGIGKSRLMAELVLRAQQTESRVLEGKCSLFESALPYAPFVEAFRGLLHARTPAQIAKLLGPHAPEVAKILPELVALLPELKHNPPLSPVEEKSRLFECLYLVLRRVAADAPLILSIEDVHWADPASLEFMHFLARRLRRDRWLMLATYRPEELERAEGLVRLRQELFRERIAQELTLNPLDPDDTAALLRAALGEQFNVPDGLSRWLHEFSEGNPFFSEEILRALVDAADRLEPGLEPSILSSIVVPATVGEAILSRLNVLTPDARGVLAAAAILGRTFDMQTVQELTGLAGDAFTHPLMTLLSMQLIRADRTPMLYAFRHHLIREVVLHNLAPDLQRSLHLRVAEVLERRGTAAPQLLVYHYHEAGERAKTYSYAAAAARDSAAVYAHDEAARYFALALESLPAIPSPDRREAAEGLGDALFHAGHMQRAAEAFGAMARCAEALGSHRELARAYRKMGRAQNEHAAGSGFEAFAKALTILADVEDPREEAMIREQASKVAFLTGQYERGVSDARAAVAAATRANDAAALSRSYKSLGLNLIMLGQRDEAKTSIQTALDLARQADDPEAELKALNDIGCMYIDDAEFGRAREALRRGCELMDRLGRVPTLTLPAITLADLSILEGHWDEADQISRSLFDQFNATKVRGYAFQCVALNVALVATLRGRLEEAEEILQDAIADAESEGNAYILVPLYAELAKARLQGGQDREARTALLRALEIGEATKFAGNGLAPVCVLIGEIALRPGTLDEAGQWAERAARYAGDSQIIAPTLARFRGQIAMQAGDLDDAVRALEAALTMPGAAAQPYEEALIRYYLGAALLRRGRPGDRKAGRDELTRSLETLERLGAKHDAEMVAAALRRIGGRPPSGHTLTQREREVLMLVAQGYTNAAIAGQLYISERTVEVHVSHILSKLDVQTRTRAAAAAVQLGLRGPN